MSAPSPLPPDRVDPARSRLPESTHRYAAILDRHRAAIEAGAAGYVDPSTGLFVFTAASLWERGVCCNSGCRHCPFVTPR